MVLETLAEDEWKNSQESAEIGLYFVEPQGKWEPGTLMWRKS